MSVFGSTLAILSFWLLDVVMLVLLWSPCSNMVVVFSVILFFSFCSFLSFAFFFFFIRCFFDSTNSDRSTFDRNNRFILEVDGLSSRTIRILSSTYTTTPRLRLSSFVQLLILLLTHINCLRIFNKITAQTFFEALGSGASVFSITLSSSLLPW